jgi:PAS domain-containing protein
MVIMQGLSLVTLENIVKILPVGVVIISKDNGKVCYVNDRAIQLYGVDPSGLEMPKHSTKLMKLLTLNGEVYLPEALPASKAYC